MTLMRFASRDAVKTFAGPKWEVSVVPPAARAVLSRFDERAAHYEGASRKETSPPPHSPSPPPPSPRRSLFHRLQFVDHALDHRKADCPEARILCVEAEGASSSE